jgi:hypothetical protein
MQFSFDNITWKLAVPFVPTKAMTLPAPDGLKTVHVRFVDQAGVVLNNNDISATITLDTKAPVGTVAITSGVLNGLVRYTNSRTVSLALTAVETGTGVSGVCIREDTLPCAPVEFIPFAATMNYNIISANDGKKTLHVRLQDNAGKISLPKVASITLDTALPDGSVIINGGAATTTSALVTLKLTSNKASQMMFSFDGGSTFSAPEKFALSKQVTLPAGSGVKTVNVKFRDLAGNEFVAQDSIILQDGSPPAQPALAIVKIKTTGTLGTGVKIGGINFIATQNAQNLTIADADVTATGTVAVGASTLAMPNTTSPASVNTAIISTGGIAQTGEIATLVYHVPVGTFPTLANFNVALTGAGVIDTNGATIPGINVAIQSMTTQ